MGTRSLKWITIGKAVLAKGLLSNLAGEAGGCVGLPRLREQQPLDERR
jgi:hypothetical protein